MALQISKFFKKIKSSFQSKKTQNRQPKISSAKTSPLVLNIKNEDYEDISDAPFMKSDSISENLKWMEIANNIELENKKEKTETTESDAELTEEKDEDEDEELDLDENEEETEVSPEITEEGTTENETPEETEDKTDGNEEEAEEAPEETENKINKDETEEKNESAENENETLAEKIEGESLENKAQTLMQSCLKGNFINYSESMSSSENIIGIKELAEALQKLSNNTSMRNFKKEITELVNTDGARIRRAHDEPLRENMTKLGYIQALEQVIKNALSNIWYRQQKSKRSKNDEKCVIILASFLREEEDSEINPLIIRAQIQKRALEIIKKETERKEALKKRQREEEDKVGITDELREYRENIKTRKWKREPEVTSDEIDDGVKEKWQFSRALARTIGNIINFSKSKITDNKKLEKFKNFEKYTEDDSRVYKNLSNLKNRYQNENEDKENEKEFTRDLKSLFVKQLLKDAELLQELLDENEAELNIRHLKDITEIIEQLLNDDENMEDDLEKLENINKTGKYITNSRNFNNMLKDEKFFR